VDPAQLLQGQNLGNITVASPGDKLQRTVSVVANVSGSAVVVKTILHGARLTPTTIAPGMIVTIMGRGLGPFTGVVARPNAAGAIETRLSGVRVLFDGIPAPLLFVQRDQINAIVPYAVYGRVSSRIQVESSTIFSVPIDVRVVDAAPGLFTISNSGRDQTAALNSDHTSNSLSNPARRGTVISVFGTGEGQTESPGQDGRVISTDLRRIILPVTAKIGGVSAEVTYAGSAPGLVSGVFQANIRIPEGVESATLPIEIQIGGATTQPASIVVR
jgi:uncharacterized protein (TIGR03437 family)